MNEARTGPKFDRKLASAIGRRIGDRRRELGIAQDLLAFEAGCYQAGISRIEAGLNAPTAPMVVSLCRALGMTPNELFGWDESTRDQWAPKAGGRG